MVTARDASWNTVLSNLTVALGANSSTRITGSYGTAQNIGFYQLTTTNQVILDGSNSGISAYSINDFTVSARVMSATGTNGGNGSAVVITVTMTDEQTNAFSDIVQPGTIASVLAYRASNGIVVNAPGAAVTSAF
jgi:hypothetical protein